MWAQVRLAQILSAVFFFAAQYSEFASGDTIISSAIGGGTINTGCAICRMLKQILSKESETNRKLDALKAQNLELEKKIDVLLGQGNCTKDARDCADLKKCGKSQSGVYTITPDDQSPFDVYCDMNTAGGGWTVIQKRLDGSVDFYRGWTDYKNGFGYLNGEFWLGLDKIKRLTNARRCRIHVDLQETNGDTAYAEYDYFAVSSERSNYQLSLGTYSGNAGDGLGGHRGHAFSTKDRDNDSDTGGHCSQMFHGAWWYTACHSSNLNGKYLHGQHSSYADGINWQQWKGYKYSAARAEMKVRPVDF